MSLILLGFREIIGRPRRVMLDLRIHPHASQQVFLNVNASQGALNLLEISHMKSPLKLQPSVPERTGKMHPLSPTIETIRSIYGPLNAMDPSSIQNLWYS